MIPIAISTRMKLNSCPLASTKMKKTVRKSTPNLFMHFFVLGILASKWWINHNRKRIRVHLPESKRYLAGALRDQYGGIIHTIKSPRRGVVWQITSDKSLGLIRESLKKVKDYLPPEFSKQLESFLNQYL